MFKALIFWFSRQPGRCLTSKPTRWLKSATRLTCAGNGVDGLRLASGCGHLNWRANSSALSEAWQCFRTRMKSSEDGWPSFLCNLVKRDCKTLSLTCSFSAARISWHHCWWHRSSPFRINTSVVLRLGTGLEMADTNFGVYLPACWLMLRTAGWLPAITACFPCGSPGHVLCNDSMSSWLTNSLVVLRINCLGFPWTAGHVNACQSGNYAAHHTIFSCQHHPKPQNL